MLLRTFVIGLIVALLAVSAAAQATTCPANVILALARAGSTCVSIERDQACFGNGGVRATGFDGTELFNQTGDLISAEAIQTLSVGDGDEYSAALLNVQASLPTNAGSDVTIFAFGDVTFTNNAPPLTEILITATGTLNIRGLPTDSAEILTQIGVRESLTANGRTADNTWVRVIVTGERGQGDIVGWAAVSSITTQADLYTLAVVSDVSVGFLHPFEDFTIATASNDPICDGTPESGVLIQTSNADEAVRLIINDVTLDIAGTVFLQTNFDGLAVNVLNGEVIESDNNYLPTGTITRTRIEGSDTPVPFSPNDMIGLPINNLPVRFAIPEPLTTDEIDQARIAYQARFVTPTAPPSDPTLLAACVRTLIINADLRAGPGTNYEIINSISADTRIDPVVAANDINGGSWYQLQNGNWISAALVSESGTCEPVTMTTYADAPTRNRLSLETCGTTNGPLRAGQTVIIEFIPPAFDNLNDANNATRIDPGRIIIENRRGSVSVSNPQAVGGGRYVRIFSTTWTAATGTYRITGDRLSYEVICDVVVSVG